jgi:NDP-sugar pyrophosphorylase family protein
MAGLSGAIIAAGRGDRLRAASRGLPKPLVEVGGEPMIVRQARAMIAVDARPVHVIVNSETAGIMQERAIVMPDGVDLCVRDTANSMESLLALGERIAAGRFLLATVDAVTNPDEFRQFVACATKLTDRADNDHVDGALGMVDWRGDKNPLFLQVARNGLITGLGDIESTKVTAGIYLFSTGIFAYGAESRSLGLMAMRQYLAHLLTRKMRFTAIEMKNVVDVDEAEDLEAARAMAECRRE